MKADVINEKLTFSKVDTTKRYYMINLSGERMGDYEICENVRKKWESGVSSDGNSNGNVNYDCTFDLKNKIIRWDDKNESHFNDFYLSNIITSQLLLYRLICMFRAHPEIEQDPYKTIWWLTIKHRKSGKKLTFGEWKGASGFWLPESSHTELKQPFKSDLEELLLFLVSDQIPHPYDRCTAGQIA
jgi:hypothetical protein